MNREHFKSDLETLLETLQDKAEGEGEWTGYICHDGKSSKNPQGTEELHIGVKLGVSKDKERLLKWLDS